MNVVNEDSDSDKISPVDEEQSPGLTPVSTAIPPKGSEGSIAWTASEFVAHEKGVGWFVALGAAAIVLAVLAYLLTRDKITTAVIVFAAIMLAIVGAKKPRELEYKVDKEGLSVGEKHFTFGQFRSFAIIRQGTFSSLVFYPLKRFNLLATAYYDPADEEKIVAILSLYLPLEEKKPDLLESLMWRIRF